MDGHSFLGGWARVRTLPFFNMTQIRQIMQSRDDMIVGSDYHKKKDMMEDYAEYNYDMMDQSENREDESKIINSRLLPFQGYPSRMPSPTTPHLEENNNEKDVGISTIFNMSGDSLAFTLCYISVFSLTLLYVGVKLTRRWRLKRARLAAAALHEAGGEEGGLVLPPCGHPQCARPGTVATFPNNYLPYPGLAAAFVPEMFSLQRSARAGLPPPVHSSASCRGRCGQCRTLARPPPSYTKLFLEEQPPSYNDALGAELVSENKVEEITDTVVTVETEDGSGEVDVELATSTINGGHSNKKRTDVDSCESSSDKQV